MKVTFKLVKLRNKKLTFRRIFGDGTMTYAHTRLHAYCSPYVPMDSGHLDQAVDITPEFVRYRSPYAHFQWAGKVFVDDRGSTYALPSHSKHPTNKDLKYSEDYHPLATSHWEEAAMAAHKEDLIKDIEDYLKRK